MVARKILSARQKRLGSEVRKLRASGNLSAEEAAKLLGVDRGKISNMESGVRPINVDRIRTLAEHCGCSDEKYVDGLVEMAQPRAKGWWSRYRGTLPQGLLDIAELEAHAGGMRASYTVHIPGLLQTSDCALAIFRAAVPALPEPELGLRLALRAERQQVLDRDQPPSYVAIVHEAALRMQFGGRSVARAQLQHLLRMSERENVTLLAVPFDRGAFPGAGHTILYAQGPVPQLDTVQIDNSHGPAFLCSDVQLAKYRSILDWLERLALSQDRSRDLIKNIADQL